MTDDIFNVKFSGDYRLLKWIIKKYKNELPYCGEIMQFAYALPYGKSVSFDWDMNGIPFRVWNSLHKDLIIARLLGRIKESDFKSFEELQKEYIDGGFHIKKPKVKKAPKVEIAESEIEIEITAPVRLIKTGCLVKNFLEEI